MSLYGDESLCGEDIYVSGPPQQEQAESADTPQNGLVAAAELVADGPMELLTEAVTPGETKLPLGLAILGACAVAVIMAASLDKKGGW